MVGDSSSAAANESGAPTEASRRRLGAAKRLIAGCPQGIADEVAVTGSVARGQADGDSDVELNCWSASLPSAEELQAWLTNAGASCPSPILGDPDATGFRWLLFEFDGFWFEAGWTLSGEFDRLARELAGGAFTDHMRLQLGQTIAEAAVIRTTGALERWKEQLASYPPGLAARIVAEQTRAWSDPHVPAVRWALARRGERVGLTLRFVWDIQNLFRLLFAINEVWDHDLKWASERTRGLRLVPDNLSPRLDRLLELRDLESSVDELQRLIVEALELAADGGYDVDRARRSVSEALAVGRRQATKPGSG